jgi:hypothetical protein
MSFTETLPTAAAPGGALLFFVAVGCTSRGRVFHFGRK